MMENIFYSTSGNGASVQVLTRAGRIFCQVLWDRPPSQEDADEFDALVREYRNPRFEIAVSLRNPAPEVERNQAYAFLYPEKQS